MAKLVVCDSTCYITSGSMDSLSNVVTGNTWLCFSGCHAVWHYLLHCFWDVEQVACMCFSSVCLPTDKSNALSYAVQPCVCSLSLCQRQGTRRLLECMPWHKSRCKTQPVSAVRAWSMYHVSRKKSSRTGSKKGWMSVQGWPGRV
jgi:hypothetical protein